MKKINTRSAKIKIAILTLIIGGVVSAFKADYFEVNKQLELFTGVFKEVNLYYVDETEPGQLMENAMNGMLKSLDPYTVFIPESDVEDFRIIQTGQYGGIGSTIRRVGDKILIADPHEGFPADKAGLRAGDWIKSVDGINMVGKSSDEVSRILKGTPGSEVELTYERDGKETTLTLKREEIQLKSVPYYGMINENTGYIYLSSFTDKASKEVKEALLELKKDPNFTQVIFDLRGNPGGLLNESVNIANLFIEKGTEVVSTKGRLKEVDNTYKTLRAAIDTEIPLAILINSGSASASEIVAGTIKDLDRGIVVGQRSYGKGLVQQQHPLQYGSQVKITIAKYYTPSGRCIQAINYAERAEDGSVKRVPDSLRTEFKTKNGRSVYDGGGVDPDLEIPAEEAAGILVSLANAGHLFDYATIYVREHDQIAPAGSFSLSDAEYQKFVHYLSDKHYEYTTDTEKSIEKLKKIAEGEDFSGLKGDLAALEEKTKKLKNDDLMRHKDQITTYLEQEIAGRYFYQAGSIRQSLKGDPIVEAAVKTLNDKNAYNEILAIAK
jgi:carboxyl-terminal processing protease